MHSPLDFTANAKTLMQERMIQEDWVENTVNFPDMIEEKRYDEKHYLKQIPQNAGNRQPLYQSPPGDHCVL